MSRYLVIAHQTASGDTLRKYVAQMVAESPESEFVLVVPATAVEDLTTWTEGQARRAAEEAGEKARQAFAVDGVHIKERHHRFARDILKTLDWLGVGGGVIDENV